MPPTIALLLLSFATVLAKVYDRCELARELRYVHQVPGHEVATWVCIVAHESIYDTAAMNPGSGDHGLFQISQLYWCSPPGDGFGCNSPCSAFRDDNIADDLKCVRRIFKEHSRISGNGFNAWAVYPLYCKGDNGRYVRGCFDNEIDNSGFGEQEIPVNITSSTGKPNEEDDDEGYEFPPLPTPPKKIAVNTIITDEDVYEFPPIPTTQRLLSYGSQRERTLKFFPNYIEPAFIVNTEPSYFLAGASPLTELFLASSQHSTITNLPSRPPSETTSSIEKKTTVEAKSTTKKTYSTKPVTTKPTSTVVIKPKQITFRPLFGNSNETITLRPILGPPRPPPSGSRPQGGPRPPFSLRPGNRPSNASRPHRRPSRPTLRPFSRLTTVDVNKNTVFSSTTSVQSISTTSSVPSKTSTSAYTSSTQKSTATQQSTVASSSTTSPVSSSATTSLVSSETRSTGKLLPSGSKTYSSPKPPPSSNSGSNGNSLKREERRYDNEFPGYLFSRIGNGFRLVQKA